MLVMTPAVYKTVIHFGWEERDALGGADAVAGRRP
jgi:hypothetical protein